MQLDIFEHSRDVMLRNDALAALQRDDPAAARAARAALAAEYPLDPALSAIDRLIAAARLSAPEAFADHAAAASALREMRDQIEPAARQLFGERDGAAWLARPWRQLARRAARLAFAREQAETHAAPLWLRAGDPAAAARAIDGIKSWRRIPEALAWMCEARWHLQGLDGCWPLLAELAWMAPARLGELARRVPDALLQRLLRRFDDEFDDGGPADLAWFPAWLLTDKPALAAALGAAQAGADGAPERGMRLLLDLLHLERQGRQRELIARRRALRELHPPLYAAYMRTR